MGEDSSDIGKVVKAEEVKQEVPFLDQVASFRAHFKIKGAEWLDTSISRTNYVCMNGDTQASKEGHVSNLFGLLRAAYPGKEIGYQELRRYFLKDSS